MTETILIGSTGSAMRATRRTDKTQTLEKCQIVLPPALPGLFIHQ